MIVYLKPHISFIIFNLRFLQLFTCFVRINNDITSVRSPITLKVPVSKSMDPYSSIQGTVPQTYE